MNLFSYRNIFLSYLSIILIIDAHLFFAFHYCYQFAHYHEEILNFIYFAFRLCLLYTDTVMYNLVV